MELYAIRYAQAPFPMKYIYRDMADSEESMPTDWLFYLALVNGKAVLFDTGFRNPEVAADWNLVFTGYEAELSALLGPRPVDRIVITHSHFDHIDNIDLYPGSDIVISREAFADVLADSPEAVKRALLEGAVTLVDIELDLEGVFHFMVIGGHEAGSSAAYFTHDGRDYVLTGDECYACSNATENRQIGSIFCNVEKNAAFTLDAYRRGLIPLPCHDKTVLEAYRKVSDNIARII